MPYIRRSPIWPDPRVKPPFGAARLRKCDEALGLVAGYLLNDNPANPYNYAAIQPAFVRTGGVQLCPQGIKGDDLAALGTADYLDVAWTPLTGAFSIISRARVTNNNNPTHCGLGHSAGTDRRGYIYNNFGDIVMVVIGSAATAQITATGAGSTTQAQVHGVISRSSTDHELYVNGSSKGTSATNVGTFDPDHWTLRALDNAGTINQGMDGVLEYVWLWNRGLSSSEVRRHYFEPYAMLEPVVRRRYFVPAAAGASGRLIGGKLTRSSGLLVGGGLVR